MVDSSNIGKTVRYYANGWHTGILVDVHPRKKLAVIEHPVFARNQRIPLSDVEIYEEKECQK
jgi:hypothetical protein